MSPTFQSTQQIASGVQNAYPVSGGLYATFAPDGHLALYAIESNTWLNIGGPGRMFAPDSLGVYGLSPDGTQVWRVSSNWRPATRTSTR